MMRKIGLGFVMVVMLMTTLVLEGLHRGTMRKPESLIASREAPTGEWIGKENYGVNMLVLKGSGFDRGRKAGELVRPLLEAQETELLVQVKRWIPNRAALKALILAGIFYFDGIEKYFEPWALQEIYGVSLSAPSEFDDLADGYTRQIGYHGLHEVGQMMMDQAGDAMGCTVVAIPFGRSWVVGRNFDFEGGRIFDEQKIVKWSFPEKSEPQENAYVSVIWAGMVGGVTGVNENGLYVSLNAAGSLDYRRIGTPSTLILTKILQFARSIDDALEILKAQQMFITDIFVLVDAKTGRAYRVEKSPLKTAITELVEPSIVTNHLLSPEFADDKTNIKRQHELTTVARYDRGIELIDRLVQADVQTARAAELSALRILRDKQGVGDFPLTLHNRRAIDAMIATHAVVYNAEDQTLYVSQGPGLSGAFTGLDLRKSFREGRPVVVAGLPADPDVSPAKFMDVEYSEKYLDQADALLRKGNCEAADGEIRMAEFFYRGSYRFHMTQGDWLDCIGERHEARLEWAEALSLSPAYASELRKLESKLREDLK